MSRLQDVNAYWTDALSYPATLALNDMRSTAALLLSVAEQVEMKTTEMSVALIVPDGEHVG